jgi:hypothetical protein
VDSCASITVKYKGMKNGMEERKKGRKRGKKREKREEHPDPLPDVGQKNQRRPHLFYRRIFKPASFPELPEEGPGQHPGCLSRA